MLMFGYPSLYKVLSQATGVPPITVYSTYLGEGKAAVPIVDTTA